jgi:hypothetical protein
MNSAEYDPQVLIEEMAGLPTFCQVVKERLYPHLDRLLTSRDDGSLDSPQKRRERFLERSRAAGNPSVSMLAVPSDTVGVPEEEEAAPSGDPPEDLSELYLFLE